MLLQLQQHVHTLTLDVVKLCVWLLLLMFIFVPLEKLYARHPQRVFRRGFITDVGYYFFNTFFTKLLLVISISVITWSLHRLTLGGLYSRVAGISLWARLAAAVIVGELGFYWGHRWMHEIPMLWRFHAIHHSAEEIDWLVNTRAHPVDIIFTRLCGLIPIYALGLVQPTGQTAGLVPLLVVTIGTAWSFFIHANVRWRLGWLGWLVSTPAFHHWHHNKLGPDYLTKNYAAQLPWVDKLFGTFYLPEKQWPLRYGIDTPTAPRLVGQLLQPILMGRPAPADRER